MTNIQNALSGLTDITSALYLKSLKEIKLDETENKIIFKNEKNDLIGYIKFSNDVSITTKETTNQENNSENPTPLLATVNNTNSNDNISGINITFNYTPIISTLVASGFVQTDPSGIITGTIATEYIAAASGIITGDFIVQENLYINDLNVNQTLSSKADMSYLTGDFYNEITGKCTYLSGTDIKIQNNEISIDYTHANTANRLVKLNISGKVQNTLIEAMPIIQLDPTITNTITPLNNTMYAITPIANSIVEFTNPTNLSSNISFQLMVTNTTPAVSWELKNTNIIWADDDGNCSEENPAPDISQDGMTYVLVFASPRQNKWFGNKAYNFV